MEKNRLKATHTITNDNLSISFCFQLDSSRLSVKEYLRALTREQNYHHSGKKFLKAYESFGD